jgi:hypothetical protein
MPDCQGGLCALGMTDLKKSVSASIGMQARHRMPPLQFWSMIIGLSAGSHLK